MIATYFIFLKKIKCSNLLCLNLLCRPSRRSAPNPRPRFLMCLLRNLRLGPRAKLRPIVSDSSMMQQRSYGVKLRLVLWRCVTFLGWPWLFLIQLLLLLRVIHIIFVNFGHLLLLKVFVNVGSPCCWSLGGLVSVSVRYYVWIYVYFFKNSAVTIAS